MPGPAATTKARHLSLTLDKPDGRFAVGEVIQGRVACSGSGGSSTTGRAVVVKLSGAVTVEWEEGPQGDDSGGLRYEATRQLFPDQRQVLLSSSSSAAATGGGSGGEWAFSLTIPPQQQPVPPSIALLRPNGRVAGVVYTVTALLLPQENDEDGSSKALDSVARVVCVTPTPAAVCVEEGSPVMVAARAALAREEVSAGHVRARVERGEGAGVVSVDFVGGREGGGGSSNSSSSNLAIDVRLRIENASTMPLTRLTAALHAEVCMSDGHTRRHEDRFLVTEEDLLLASGQQQQQQQQPELPPGQTLIIQQIALSKLRVKRRPASATDLGNDVEPSARNLLQSPSISVSTGEGIFSLSYTLVVSAHYPGVGVGPVALVKMPLVILPK